ncbi:hypothetical protein QBC38DRAFT_448308, partial [Podospora fimiseda]
SHTPTTIIEIFVPRDVYRRKYVVEVYPLPPDAVPCILINREVQESINRHNDAKVLPPVPAAAQAVIGTKGIDSHDVEVLPRGPTATVIDSHDAEVLLPPPAAAVIETKSIASHEAEVLPRAPAAPGIKTQSVRSNSQGTLGNSPPAAVVPTPVKAEPTVSPQPPPLCSNCKLYGHRLSECIKADQDGTMHGCPYCEVTTHEVDSCTKEHQVRAAWRILGQGRARKLKSTNRRLWYRLALTSRIQGRVPNLPEGSFPWSRKFSAQWTKNNPDAWKTFDYTKGLNHDLPVDPTTSTWDIIKENKDVKEAIEKREARLAQEQENTKKRQSENSGRVGSIKRSRYWRLQQEEQAGTYVGGFD